MEREALLRRGRRTSVRKNRRPQKPPSRSPFPLLITVSAQSISKPKNTLSSLSRNHYPHPSSSGCTNQHNPQPVSSPSPLPLNHRGWMSSLYLPNHTTQKAV
ncbi:hypothetical protein RIF29_09009 [Crotalaria pallida]|uniref:Uncharacterized protein n=1 Tax=Crotalaria pallida TaxID=3830 RepID=A0AAN9FRE4_CROPI